MADSGSDTETDDELLERVQASQSKSLQPHDSEVVNDARSADKDLLEPTKQASEVAPPQPVDNRDAASRDTVATAENQASADTQTSTTRKSAGFLALVVNSDDDEARRFDPPPQDQAVARSQPPSQATQHAPPPSVAPPTHRAMRSHVSVPVRSTVHVPIEKREPPTAPPVDLPLADRPQEVEPAASTNERDVAPSDDQFISPFASLAAPYRPPPPPVYGAPPVSYVPGRSVPGTFAQHPASLAAPPLLAPHVPCFKCSRVLSNRGSSTPRPGYSACSCCQRYYSQVAIRPGVSTGRLCSICVGSPARPPPGPTPAPVPVSAQVPVPVSTQVSPTAIPSAPAVTPVQPGTALPGTTIKCGLCKESVRIIPPVLASDRMQCNCCEIVMSKEAFSSNQRRPSHPCRRCSSCAKARVMPAKFKNIHQKPAPVDTTLREKQRQVGAQSPAAPPGAPVSRVECTPEERHQMEIEVRNYKLAKRSIQRRRMANDLRGSTRVEYEMQLHDEEQKVEAKMARARRTNPALFDELSQDTKVKSVPVAPWERDNPAPKKKSSKKTTPTKQATKTKAKLPVAKATKRKPPTESGELDVKLPATKRTRVSPVRAPAAKAVSKTEHKIIPSTVSSAEDSSDASPPRAVTTRTRTRQTPKPIIIDLVDSDSD